MDNRALLSGAGATPPTAPVSPSIGHPVSGVPGVSTPSVLGPFWFHQVGEELRAVIEAGGLTPSQGSLNQLLTAMQAMFGTVLTTAGVPDGISVGGFIIQLKAVTFVDVPTGVPGATGSATWARPFPTACLAVLTGFEVAAGGGAANNFAAAITDKSPTGCSYQIQEWANVANPGTLNLLAVGY